MSEPVEPLLEVSGLVKEFALRRSLAARVGRKPPRKLTAVDDVAFSLERKTTLGIVA